MSLFPNPLYILRADCSEKYSHFTWGKEVLEKVGYRKYFEPIVETWMGTIVMLLHEWNFEVNCRVAEGKIEQRLYGDIQRMNEHVWGQEYRIQ